MKISVLYVLSLPLAFAAPTYSQAQTAVPTERKIDRDLVVAARSGESAQVLALLKQGADAKAFNGGAIRKTPQLWPPEKCVVPERAKSGFWRRKADSW